MAEIGLMYYNARWYDPALGRFTSADTITPVQQGTQAWDRYAGMNNNPVKYTNPSGHCISGGWDTIICIGIAFVAIVVGVEYDKGRQHAVPPGKTGCKGQLTECFRQHQVSNFTSGEEIDQNEFEDMLVAISDDIDNRIRTPIDLARTTYDTPFYTGNGRKGENARPDQIVCIGEICSPQSAVNYVAQGMYAADSGSIPWVEEKIIIPVWNMINYRNTGTSDEKYWFRYGYDYYKTLKEDRVSH